MTLTFSAADLYAGMDSVVLETDTAEALAPETSTLTCSVPPPLLRTDSACGPCRVKDSWVVLTASFGGGARAPPPLARSTAA